MEDINSLREKINALDDKIVLLLEKRLEISEEIGAYKKKNKMDIFDPKREGEILEKIGARLVDREKEKYILKIYEEIFSQSKKSQI